MKPRWLDSGAAPPAGDRTPCPVVFLFALLVPALFGAGDAVASPAEPWLDGAFAAEATAVARAAAGIDAGGADVAADPVAGDPVVMLFRDDRFSFDADRRMTHTRRWVYQVLTPAGLEGWSTTEVSWTSWHQDRPQLRVRVVDPGGGETWLEPEAVLDLTAAQAGLDGQRRLLRARLPLVAGAVVEEEVIVRDAEPLFAAGVSVKHLLAMSVPIRRGRLTLEAPTALPLRYGIRMTPLARHRAGTGQTAARERSIGDRVEVTFDYVDLPAALPIEAGLPAEEPRHPHVAFSTGASWSALASAYARAVDERLAEAAAVRRWLPNRGASARIDRIADVLEGLRGNLRHEAAALGSAPLLPSSPLATLRRGAGDGKDLAVVMAAALRADGIPAAVALVRAGYGMDVEPELPGLGRFNHALVYTAGLWIDPSDPFSRAGELASDRQGRLALVAAAGTHQLVRTPVTSSADNRTITEIEVYMAEAGPARVVETSTHFGAAEHRQRLVSSQVDEAGRRLGYQAYLEAAYRAETMAEVEETAATDLSAPFRLRLEALKAGRAWTSADEGALAIDLSSLITTLPRELLLAGGKRRQRDFVFHEPFIAEWRYRIHPPARMTLRALPEDLSQPLGSGRLTRTFGLEGSVVRADFQLDSGPRRITAEGFHAFRDAVQKQLQEQAVVLWFD